MLFDKLRSWSKYNDIQNMKDSTVKSSTEFFKLHEVKGLDEKAETGRLELKTKFINQHFINELDKIGLLLINIRGSRIGGLVVLLEQTNLNSTLA